MPSSCRYLLGAFALLLLIADGVQAAEPTPFSARYHLEVAGWPDAVITHRLSRQAGQWQSEMRADINIASGLERGRFRLGDRGLVALHYASRYQLLGFGRSYELKADELARFPDRQTALVALSQRATQACPGTCRLHYVDHRGRPKVVEYRLLARETLPLRIGEVEALQVEVREPDHPDRRLEIAFHSRVPGLLLAMSYHRDGTRRSRLTLIDMDLTELAQSGDPR
ncbi:hypothetical protein [Halomonas cerina]|uniref:DUF3108 domain-containing protein n=1 Tax=Halomonas cerina TaxID=447424 RepID=A0A839V2W7_9GAMM|nr:hypothetical protein [Halomonas cerina]MBB3189501.1 hypothetical protein [Halomonas cerina]